MGEKRPASFYWLALTFAVFVLFLYGPVITILVLSFQGPQGGLTFPMNGVSFHWFVQLTHGIGLIDISQGLWNSLALGLIVMVLTVVFS
ncbi:MAG: ABC transporter permease, partial [Bradyrhizobiaceae bacterium]|nr:ABC transporter permease [Bradyrhizobiaceae bacterium]